nr:MAG TPA: hypothetical protein [Caudoviricetes sp.]
MQWILFLINYMNKKSPHIPQGQGYEKFLQ